MPALILLAYTSLLMQGLLDNVRGPFFPEILSDMHLSGTVGSLFFATTSLLSFVGSWSSHFFITRHSSLFLMALASVMVACGFAGVALTQEFYFWLGACGVLGWAFGALNLSQNLMVFEAGSAQTRRRLFSGLHSMYGLAALLAPFVASLVRWLGFNWRQGFLLLALFPLVLALVSVAFKPERMQRMAKIPVLSRHEWLKCLAFAGLMSGYLWGEISVSTRLVLWLRDELGYSPDMANLYLGGFFLTLLAGRIFFSFVHFAALGNWFILWLSAGVSALCYFLALEFSPVWIVISGFTMAPFFPLGMDQVAKMFQQKSAQAMGFILGFGSLSVVALHLLLGYCSDEFGLGRALLMGPLSLLFVFAALSVVVWRTQSVATKGRMDSTINSPAL